MKILHITPTYLPAYKYGGPIESVHALNKTLVKKGADVTVYTTNLNAQERLNVPLSQEVNMDGVKVFYFPTTFRPWQYSRAMHAKLAESAGDFDLIHITSVFLSASTLGAHYAKKFNKPYIISPRGSLMREPLARKSPFKKKIYLELVEKRNLRDASAIHFTSQVEKEEYVCAYLPLKKEIVAGNILDPAQLPDAPLGALRKKLGLPEKSKIVLFLGRINWKKGFDTLIAAFAEVVKKIPEARLVIAGNDEEGYKDKVEEWIKQYNLESKVVFAGFLNGADKTAAYKDSNVFVLPSYSENFGMAVAEAMYMRLPVVVSPGTALGMEVEAAGAGLVVKKDVQTFAQAMEYILSGSAKTKDMGAHGRALVEKEFLPEAIGEKMLQAYNELI